MLKNLLISCMLAVALTACSSISTPDTFNQKLAVAYGTVTQVRTTTTQLLQAGKIHSDDAQNVQMQADHARAGLDIAKKMSGTDLSTATGKLSAVRVVLDALVVYLSTRQ